MGTTVTPRANYNSKKFAILAGSDPAPVDGRGSHEGEVVLRKHEGDFAA